LSALTNEEFLSGLAKSNAPVTTEYVTKQLAPILSRLDALEKELKSREYRGLYQAGHEYEKGNSVSYNGSLWICVSGEPATRNAGPLATCSSAGKRRQRPQSRVNNDD
jgi:hypothetical protein